VSHGRRGVWILGVIEYKPVDSQSPWVYRARWRGSGTGVSNAHFPSITIGGMPNEGPMRPTLGESWQRYEPGVKPCTAEAHDGASDSCSG